MWWRETEARPERDERTQAFWRAVGAGEPEALAAGNSIPEELALAVARNADLFYELVVSNWAMSSRTRSPSGA